MQGYVIPDTTLDNKNITFGLARKLGPLKSQCGLRLPQQARLIVDFTH